MPELRVGISGWRYPPWRGTFYPPGLPQRAELASASRQVNSIEINGTFYSLQSRASFQTWRRQTPDNFVFSLKGGRFVTHLKRLRDVEVPLANYFASGVLALGPKLGPFLWQLPPNFAFDAVRLENFFRLLPRDTSAAAALARRANREIVPRPFLAVEATRPLRHCLEVRHASFACPEAVALLRSHDIGLVVADTAGRWPFLEDLTSGFVYVRLHGEGQLYVGGYTPESLDGWAAKIRAWLAGDDPADARRLLPPQPPREGGRAVYVYFDNDVKTRAPFDAQALAHRVGLGGPPPGQGPSPADVFEEPRTEWPGMPRKRPAGSGRIRTPRPQAGASQRPRQAPRPT